MEDHLKKILKNMEIFLSRKNTTNIVDESRMNKQSRIKGK